MAYSKKFSLTLALATLLMASTLEARTMTYALKSSPHNMDPMSVYDVPTHSFNINLFDALVERDQNLQLQPALALTWKNTSDLVWRFELRKGVKFHDGSPFSADDVVFSFARANSKGSDISGTIASVSKIVKIDDHTVEVHTKQKNPLLPAEIYSMPIFSKIWCEKHKCENVADVTKKEESFADRNANGTGAFKLEKYEAESQIVLVKNPDFWGGADKVKLDRVVFKPVANDATRLAGLLSGDFDLIAPVPVQDVEKLKEKKDTVKIQETEALLTVYLGMNQTDDKLKSSKADKNPFKDVRVRKAVAHAVDVEAIKQKIMHGFSRPTGSLAGKGVNGYDEKLDVRYPYDIEKSKALLTEAGFPNGFDITMDCSNDRYTKDEMVCQTVVQYLAKVGIKANPIIQPKSKFFQKVLGYDTDFYMMGWMPATYDAHDVYYNLLATRKDGNQGKYNLGGYSNPKFDDLVNKVHTEMDQTKRNALIGELIKIAHDDVANIPLHQEKLVWGMKKDLDIPIRADDFIILKDVK